MGMTDYFSEAPPECHFLTVFEAQKTHIKRPRVGRRPLATAHFSPRWPVSMPRPGPSTGHEVSVFRFTYFSFQVQRLPAQ